MKILLNSTPVALWHDIVHDAEIACSTRLREEIESYLVFLLVRYTNKPDTLKHVIATDILEGLKLGPHERELALQGVGDRCLIFSGLFPKIAEKRLVKISYFINLGQTAYGTISKKRSDVYHGLARQFVGLMDILQSIRNYSQSHPDLLPLQAYDLWNETGSQRALSVLKLYSDGAIPNKTPHLKD